MSDQPMTVHPLGRFKLTRHGPRSLSITVPRTIVKGYALAPGEQLMVGKWVEQDALVVQLPPRIPDLPPEVNASCYDRVVRLFLTQQCYMIAQAYSPLKPFYSVQEFQGAVDYLIREGKLAYDYSHTYLIRTGALRPSGVVYE